MEISSLGWSGSLWDVASFPCVHCTQDLYFASDYMLNVVCLYLLYLGWGGKLESAL